MTSKLLKQKFRMKNINAKKEGIAFCLSIDEIEDLLKQANITEQDWSLRGYQLARFNDTGDYKLGNCRFIPAAENIKERKPSQRSIQASKNNLRDYRDALSKEEKSEFYSRLGRLGGKIAGPKSRITDEEIIRRFQLVKHLDWACQDSKIRRRIVKQASKILNYSGTHIRRLRERWLALGLI